MSSKASAAATSTTKNLVPQWAEAMESATIENVSNLKQYNHGWLCTILPSNTEETPLGILAILDITNRISGKNQDPKYMNIGPMPPQGLDIVKALLSTMMKNSYPDKKSEFGQSRRPAWILLDERMRTCLPLVSSILATVDVVVKLNTPDGLSQQTTTTKARKATWEDGLPKVGKTLENIMALPKKQNEIWKCSMTMIVDPKTQARECFLAIEDITKGDNEKDSFPVGVGPCEPITVNPDAAMEAIFATMLCPRNNNTNEKEKEKKYGEPKRPGKIVLDKALEPWLQHFQCKITENVDVEVVVEEA